MTIPVQPGSDIGTYLMIGVAAESKTEYLFEKYSTAERIRTSLVQKSLISRGSVMIKS